MNVEPRKVLLGRFMENSLKDALGAERSHVKFIPKMINKVRHPDLKTALSEHLTDTERHIEIVELIFESLDTSPRANKSNGMDGILLDCKQMLMDSHKNFPDTIIITSVCRAAHYKSSAYFPLHTVAKSLHMVKEADLLRIMLDEIQTVTKKMQALHKAIIRHHHQ